MKRREFITLLGCASAWPLAARAQQAEKLPSIGFLGATTALAGGQWAVAFVQRLHELGWIENRTVTIERRWAEGRDERFAEIAAEFIRLKVNVIVTYGTPSAIAAKKSTAVIPIVIAGAGDLVGAGLVTSLARPGGNVTGLSIQGPDLAGKPEPRGLKLRSQGAHHIQVGMQPSTTLPKKLRHCEMRHI